MSMRIELPGKNCENCGKCVIVCPDNLYVVDLTTEKVAIADDTVFNELEDRLSGALLNLIREQIYADGTVSEDEKALLGVITRSFSTFRNMRKVAEPILFSAKKYLFKKIWEEAIKDDVISEDEQAILDIIVDKLKIAPNEKEQFMQEVEAEAQAVKKLRQKLKK
jgi:ferredoxin